MEGERVPAAVYQILFSERMTKKVDSTDFFGILLERFFVFSYHSGLPFVGITPDIDWAHRELEIQKWLETAVEPIESFVILDDLEFDFPRMFPKNFVQTSGFLKRGLTWSQAVKTIKILNCSV